MTINSKIPLIVVAIFVLVAAVGCGDDARTDDDSSDDDDDNNDNDSQGDDDDDDSNPGFCTNDALRDIFVLTTTKNLYRFAPDKKSFTQVGKVGCQTGDSSDLAFSMAVSNDMEGLAYILFVDEYVTTCKGIYKISTDNASCIEKTKFQCGDNDFKFFGMAFSTESATSAEETLFLAAGSPKGTGSTKLGTLDLESGDVSSFGSIDLGIPELTGNAKGELWGLFLAGTPPVISQINKATGKRGDSFDVTNIPDTTYGFAGAFWGGDFYLFHMKDQNSNSTVYKVNGETGATELYMSSTGLKISGAGVSTCAPIVPE